MPTSWLSMVPEESIAVTRAHRATGDDVQDAPLKFLPPKSLFLLAGFAEFDWQLVKTVDARTAGAGAKASRILGVQPTQDAPPREAALNRHFASGLELALIYRKRWKRLALPPPRSALGAVDFARLIPPLRSKKRIAEQAWLLPGAWHRYDGSWRAPALRSGPYCNSGRWRAGRRTSRSGSHRLAPHTS